MTTQKQLHTRRGVINLPAYIPVTTFGKKYPLDELIRPYLPRLAQALMVSYHYARQMKEKPRLPLMVDSGGFASLFKNANVIKRQGVGVIEIRTDEGTDLINPLDVIELQEEIAEVAFTLDFPIPTGLEKRDAKKRLSLTITNAMWALENKRRRDLPLFACVQGWDEASYLDCARAYVDSAFEGIAIGGLIPRMRNETFVLNLVKAIREMHPSKHIHVFGLGQPVLVKKLYEHGVDSVDSSAYVKMAAEGRLWGGGTHRLNTESPTIRLHLAICNLAIATNRTLPLGFSGIRYSTPSLESIVSVYPYHL
jgi:tRNA-guanine family transglycosylase